MARHYEVLADEIEPNIEDVIELSYDHDGNYVRCNYLVQAKRWLNEFVLNSLKGIREGDLVTFGDGADYDTLDGTFIWTGTELQSLDGGIDDKPNIPSNFEVTDEKFAPDWWSGLIRGVFWPASQIRQRIKDTDLTFHIGKKKCVFVGVLPKDDDPLFYNAGSGEEDDPMVISAFDYF